MFMVWSLRRICVRSAIIALFAVAGAKAVAHAGEGGTPARSAVERLPPVAAAAPLILPQQPTELSPRHSASQSAGNALLLGDSFARRMDEVPDEAPPSGTQSVVYSAMAAAQTTLSQGYYAGADYLLIRPQMSEPVRVLVRPRQ